MEVLTTSLLSVHSGRLTKRLASAAQYATPWTTLPVIVSISLLHHTHHYDHRFLRYSLQNTLTIGFIMSSFTHSHMAWLHQSLHSPDSSKPPLCHGAPTRH